MQAARPQHASRADYEQRDGKSEANPKTPAHAAQLVIVFLRCAYCNAWLKRHATDRTDSGPVGENLRMHWAHVLGCCGAQQLRLQSHSAFGTRSRFRKNDLRIHGAKIFG